VLRYPRAGSGRFDGAMLAFSGLPRGSKRDMILVSLPHSSRTVTRKLSDLQGATTAHRVGNLTSAPNGYVVSPALKPIF
jgi:hypothetical protein